MHHCQIHINLISNKLTRLVVLLGLPPRPVWCWPLLGQGEGQPEARGEVGSTAARYSSWISLVVGGPNQRGKRGAHSEGKHWGKGNIWRAGSTVPATRGGGERISNTPSLLPQPLHPPLRGWEALDWTGLYFFHFFFHSSTGPAAISGSRISHSPARGGGDPLCVLASSRWGPTYIASFTHTLGSWEDFYEVLQLLMWRGHRWPLGPMKEASGTALCSSPSPALGLQHCLRPTVRQGRSTGRRAKLLQLHHP